MLFSDTNTQVRPAANTANTADAGKTTLGGGYRMPAQTADAKKITLGGGYRLVTHTA